VSVGPVRVEGRLYVPLEVVAELYQVKRVMLMQVYERGLLGTAIEHEQTLCIEAVELERVATIVRLHELLGLDVQGERIPLLECVLDRYAERMQPLVELKACEPAASRERDLVLARKVADTIRRAGVVDRSLVLSFDTGMLAACREQAPELRVARNLKPPRALTVELREQLLWLHTLSCDVRHLSEEFGAELREAGRPLYVYTCNTPGKVDRALAAGAEAIMTDRPAWLAEYLARGDAGGP